MTGRVGHSWLLEPMKGGEFETVVPRGTGCAEGGLLRAPARGFTITMYWVHQKHPDGLVTIRDNCAGFVTDGHGPRPRGSQDHEPQPPRREFLLDRPRSVHRQAEHRARVAGLRPGRRGA